MRSGQTFNFALGDENKSLDINRANNSQSSSLLEMMPAHVESAPTVRLRGEGNGSGQDAGFRVFGNKVDW